MLSISVVLRQPLRWVGTRYDVLPYCDWTCPLARLDQAQAAYSSAQILFVGGVAEDCEFSRSAPMAVPDRPFVRCGGDVERANVCPDPVRVMIVDVQPFRIFAATGVQ